MHIILGILGTIVTILVLLNRLAEAGIDLGGLNPFLWRRRRAWRQKYEGNPVYKLSDPMEVTAVLMAAIAKIEGDISSQQKLEILRLFRSEFHLSRKDASSLLVATTHILGRGDEVVANVDKVLAPSLENFSPDQASSCVDLMRRVAEVDGAMTPEQRTVIAAAEAALAQQAVDSPDTW